MEFESLSSDGAYLVVHALPEEFRQVNIEPQLYFLLATRGGSAWRLPDPSLTPDFVPKPPSTSVETTLVAPAARDSRRSSWPRFAIFWQQIALEPGASELVKSIASEVAARRTVAGG